MAALQATFIIAGPACGLRQCWRKQAQLIDRDRISGSRQSGGSGSGTAGGTHMRSHRYPQSVHSRLDSVHTRLPAS